MKNKALFISVFACLIINSILSSDQASVRADQSAEKQASSIKPAQPVTVSPKPKNDIDVPTQISQEIGTYYGPAEKSKKFPESANASTQVEREVAGYELDAQVRAIKKSKPSQVGEKSKKYPKLPDVLDELVLESAIKKDLSTAEKIGNYLSGNSSNDQVDLRKMMDSKQQKERKKQEEKGYAKKMYDLYNDYVATPIENFLCKCPGSESFSEYVVSPIKNNTKMALLLTVATVVIVAKSFEDRPTENQEIENN